MALFGYDLLPHLQTSTMNVRGVVGCGGDARRGLDWDAVSQRALDLFPSLGSAELVITHCGRFTRRQRHSFDLGFDVSDFNFQISTFATPLSGDLFLHFHLRLLAFATT